MVQFTLNKDLDPNATSLRMLLEAHFRYEQMSAARSLCFHLLAVVSVVLWVGAIWPALLPSQVEAFALALWGGFLFLTIWVGVEEWVWHRRVTRYLAEHQAKQGQALIKSTSL